MREREKEENIERGKYRNRKIQKEENIERGKY